jgi:hypothetical protein
MWCEELQWLVAGALYVVLIKVRINGQIAKTSKIDSELPVSGDAA